MAKGVIHGHVGLFPGQEGQVDSRDFQAHKRYQKEAGSAWGPGPAQVTAVMGVSMFIKGLGGQTHRPESS
jgi:hypothetical protein